MEIIMEFNLIRWNPNTKEFRVCKGKCNIEHVIDEVRKTIEWAMSKRYIGDDDLRFYDNRYNDNRKKSVSYMSEYTKMFINYIESNGSEAKLPRNNEQIYLNMILNMTHMTNKILRNIKSINTE
jgi:hypothetical protein